MPLNEYANYRPKLTERDADVWAHLLGRQMELAQAREQRADEQHRKRLYGNGASATFERPEHEVQPQYVYKPFPKMMYGPNGEKKVVQDQQELNALGPEWGNRPQPEVVAVVESDESWEGSKAVLEAQSAPTAILPTTARRGRKAKS